MFYMLTTGTSISGLHECYHCEKTRDLNDCNRIETCQQDEVQFFLKFQNLYVGIISLAHYLTVYLIY